MVHKASKITRRQFCLLSQTKVAKLDRKSDKASKFSTSWSSDIIEFDVLLVDAFSSPLPFFLTNPVLRKACVTCGCSMVDHAPGSDVEDDQRMGRLLADSPCAHLTAKVKGGGGLRLYKRNRMIVTNPVVSRKDPTFNTTTYDWAPAGLNQTLVRISVKYGRLVVGNVGQ